MSGSDSSDPAAARPEAPALVSFSVHALPSPALATEPQRTARGRWLMLLVLTVCAAPVVASYLAYYVVRRDVRTNYSELIQPPRAMPAGLPITDLRGRAVAPPSLRGQWLLVVVSGGACDAGCEKLLWLQRQLHETLGAEKDRVDKVWIVDDDIAPRIATLRAIGAADGSAPSSSAAAATIAPATVLRVPRGALSAWLEAAAGRHLEDHLFIVDPFGDWMMRAPADPEPPRLKRDVERLLRASAGWDRAGRP
jgi:hypothetical protein